MLHEKIGKLRLEKKIMVTKIKITTTINAIIYDIDNINGNVKRTITIITSIRKI